VAARVHFRRFSSAIAAAAVIAGCGGGHHEAPPAGGSVRREDPGPRLVVVGDSLAAGRFAGTQDEAFPEQVAAATRSRLELDAAPGLTTAALAAQPVPGGGDVAVVEAGTNDFLYQTPRRRFAEDYRALLAKVAAASPGAKLVCLTIWIPEDAKGQAPAKIPASFYDETIRRACAAGAVADVAPLFARPALHGPAGRTTFLGPGDAFHPNSKGHAAIARLIESRLRAA
jgi:acyl-CoA thioesterase I